jgi:hypothetical protein
MSNLRDAARQALEALEGWKDDAPSQWSTNDEKTITALREALAEEALQRLTEANQEIEPVLEQPEHGVTLKPVFYAPRRLSNEEVLAVIGPPCATQDCMPSKCSLAAQNTELDRVLVEMEHALNEAGSAPDLDERLDLGVGSAAPLPFD